ncbi:MAG: hydrogenase maturation peptidase HycI [Atribacterota bacterium]|nr:hydrogenase maturation peptidase HycI [Atribacterota bacterium]
MPSKEGKLLVVTVGNSLRSDDGVGIYIFNQIKQCKENIIILNANSKPENIIDQVVQIKPQRVIIIDAADFGGRAGEMRLIRKNNIQNRSLSTHSFSLDIIARIIEEDTGAEVLFLGIQPRSVRLREGLSKSVRKAAERIIRLLWGRFY